MAEKIIINIKEDGAVEVKTHGFKGKACMKSSQFIEEALGTITATRKTADFYSGELEERVRVNRG
jgi:hypothetical protein